MAIRDRFRRALHKSESDDNISQTESNMTTQTSSESGSTTPSSIIHKQPTNTTTNTTASNKSLWSWSSRTDKQKEQRKEQKEKDKQKQRDAKDKSKKPTHPRDKPLTAQNLRHQELLSSFDFAFGASPNRRSQIVHDFEMSPCCTRPASIDGNEPDEDIAPPMASLAVEPRSAAAVPA